LPKPIVFAWDPIYSINVSKPSELPVLLSIPHAGEDVPPEVTWLHGLPETTLMRDVDRFVDQLYGPAMNKYPWPCVVASTHRYVVDLNRGLDEYDQDAVLGAPNPSRTFPKGLHWSITTESETLIHKPMSMELHNQVVRDYYQTFHDQLHEAGNKIREQYNQVFHLDLHSMPSKGTSLHPDPGQMRAEVVISDFHGQSCSSHWRDLVMHAFQGAGFEVAYNWPYVGGGITKMYGQPDQSWHTLQIELNRNLYMNESTKKIIEDKAQVLQKKLVLAFDGLAQSLQGFLNG
jgi:N-formylglutamate deformylase